MRDKDYRGQRAPIDFARAVHQVRMGRPGALEVLQDVLLMYFPRQLAESIEVARHHANVTDDVWLVGFDARRARNRFRRWQDPRSTLNSPFWEYSRNGILDGGMPAHTAFVWSSWGDHRPPSDLQWRK